MTRKKNVLKIVTLVLLISMLLSSCGENTTGKKKSNSQMQDGIA